MIWLCPAGGFEIRLATSVQRVIWGSEGVLSIPCDEATHHHVADELEAVADADIVAEAVGVLRTI